MGRGGSPGSVLSGSWAVPVPEPSFASGPWRGGRQREGGAGPEAGIQGLQQSQRFPPTPSRTPRPVKWAYEWEGFLVLDFPLEEYLAPLSFQTKPADSVL